MQDGETEDLSRGLSLFVFFLEGRVKDLIECFQKAFANNNEVRRVAATGCTKHRWDNATLENTCGTQDQSRIPTSRSLTQGD